MKTFNIILLCLLFVFSNCKQKNSLNELPNGKEESTQNENSELEENTQNKKNSSIDNSDNSVESSISTNVNGGNGNITSTSENELAGKGNIATRSLELQPFNAIEVSNYCDVEIVKDKTNKVKYSDYENIIDNLEFVISDNKLFVKSKRNNTSISNSKAKAKIYLAGNLSSLVISGSADATISSPFNSLNELMISGSGDITCSSPLKANDISCTITGSGDMNLFNISANNAECKVVGSGDISINVVRNLESSIIGSGDIKYKGNPRIDKKIIGSGELTKVN